jgi:xanthine dehydrogenase YagT iron-sulfur-binding subunit
MESFAEQWTGRVAPAFAVRNGRHTLSLDTLDRQPVVLAFVDEWIDEAAPAPRLERIRAELRGLGAVLVTLAPSGLCVFRPDDDVERHASAGELHAAELASLYAAFGLREGAHGASGASGARGVRGPTAALFVIDDDRVVRFAHAFAAEVHVAVEALTEALAAAGRVLVRASSTQRRERRDAPVLSRRELVTTSLVAAFALAFLDGCTKHEPGGAGDGGGAPGAASVNAGNVARGPGIGDVEVTLDINGAPQKLTVDPRTTVLDALRERLGLTGTKKGCDHGQCGACTIHLDGRRVKSCLIFAQMAQGSKITTIEGLAKGETLHPMQQAFVSEDGLQCGYCTPGQIMSAVALLAEGHASTDAEVREAMSGNLCRCGAYTNIVSAIQLARKRA